MGRVWKGEIEGKLNKIQTPIFLYLRVLQMNHHKIIQPSSPNISIGQIQTPRNQSQFYATLRRYTERLKQQRDISLAYLTKINQLQAQLRIKDSEIDRLNRVNKDLADKLSLYTSVIERSQPKRSMRMSMLLGKNSMTQSIIQTQQEVDFYGGLKPFEQFFIIDLAQTQKGMAKFKFNFETNNEGQQQTAVLDLFINNSSPAWDPEPIGLTGVERKSHFVMYLSNSPYTTKINKPKHYQLVDELNPSYYYFICCMIQKQFASIGGKLYLVPVVYGFVTLLPFPDTYFRLLQDISIQLKNKNEIEQIKLVESLNELMKCPVDLLVQTRYLFLSKLHLWKIPDINNIDAYALIFSLGVIEKFALQLIIDVLILLLLEIPITVISQDELLICQFMFYFLYIIKPLKYPFPIVFNVTEKLRDLLESPFPTFTGCTDSKIVDPYLNERAVFDLDKKVAKSWPLLDHLDSSRQFLMRVASRTNNYSRFNLVTEEIIKGHQYRELEPYWKDFSKTQLYQNYVHRH